MKTIKYTSQDRHWTIKRLKAFGYAFEGIKMAFVCELPVRIQVWSFALLCLLGFFLHWTLQEWSFMLICSTLIIVTELINTALEKLCDLITLEHRHEIKYIKDLAAGAVLLQVITAFIVGWVLVIRPLFV